MVGRGTVVLPSNVVVRIISLASGRKVVPSGVVEACGIEDMADAVLSGSEVVVGRATLIITSTVVVLVIDIVSASEVVSK